MFLWRRRRFESRALAASLCLGLEKGDSLSVTETALSSVSDNELVAAMHLSCAESTASMSLEAGP